MCHQIHHHHSSVMHVLAVAKLQSFMQKCPIKAFFGSYCTLCQIGSAEHSFGIPHGFVVVATYTDNII
jgi:hypothetical protein